MVVNRLIMSLQPACWPSKAITALAAALNTFKICSQSEKASLIDSLELTQCIAPCGQSGDVIFLYTLVGCYTA